jgi:peptidoglycan hydrolase-like protein with peptidoglycan-binding domain
LQKSRPSGRLFAFQKDTAMFTDTNVKLIVAAATQAGIDPAALLSVVECETNGSPFEVDGRTPVLLYERHVAFREAAKVGKSVQNAFIKAGLAIPKWNKATQYKDEGTSALRLALITRARAIHEEVTNASASWGLGQTLGNQFEELGFATATDLVEYMTEGGLTAQIKVLIAEVKAKSLIKALNTKDFTTFARRYNGPGYAKNQYDTRMAAADKRWTRKLETVASRTVAPAYQSLNKRQIEAIQQQLADLGYKMVGIIDGKWGTNTVAAVNAFQHNEGLPETGDYDEATKAALATAQPRILDEDRQNATADGLRGSSRTIDSADRISAVGTAKRWMGGLMVAGGGAEQCGLLGQAQTAVDKVNQAKGLWTEVHGFIEPLTGNPTLILIGIVLIVAGFFVSKYAKKIIEHRVEDHNTGAHTGTAT